ncbi:MAG: 1,4-alpha-glucan branching protein GlgB [Lachnospiraceae bacterium]|nr:1,4-alpha-glucan branching protein GlgB [Lachnospiraceae bacterium]
MNDKLYKLMDWPEIEAVVYSEEDDPHHILGPHVVGSGVLVQAFVPGAESIRLQVKGGKSYKMELADEAGYFACLLPGKKIPEYTFLVGEKGGSEREIEDPYRFAPIISKKDTQKFNAGTHYEAYRMLGAHLMTVDGVAGVHFAVWAPNAQRVSVVGDFNDWDGRAHQMRRLWDSGIFELFIPGITEGSIYKFEIKVKGGLTYLKADPYAFGQQLRPDTASVVRDIDSFAWEDQEWIRTREQYQGVRQPLSVYEMHLASFAKPQTEDGKKEGFCNYRELAPKIISYVKEMGYTHIELMPVMEHPFDASWGYQVIGYYAPTARYGTPEDFMYFVNEMHKAGIGVILDWVPAHFPRDTYGLSNFDGTCLYEHQDPRKGSHPHWGTLIYNYGRPEVSNYLIANALYWVEQFHADGIRMDAVASMLYLDYGKNDGEWVANIYGGNENLEAIEFLKHLNSVLHKRDKGAITIAEESTAWPRVTGELKENGLGFDYKWNMGWMNDYLQYIKYDPYFRAHHHGELTFSMIYAYSEKFMLVFSHDEVVHGKATMIGKMPGRRKDQFANLRATYAYMMMHPGKKLLFMGQDLAEYDEWNEERELEWNLLEVEEHRQINDLVKTLNHFYREQPALYAMDDQAEGFEWINGMNAQDCVLTFLRKTKQTKDMLLVVVNFANVERKGYRIGVPFAGKYKEVLNTDAECYGGTGVVNKRQCCSDEKEWDGRENSVEINIGPLSVTVFTCTPYTEEELKEMIWKAAVKEKEEALRIARLAEERAKKAEEELEKVRKAKAAGRGRRKEAKECKTK